MKRSQFAVIFLALAATGVAGAAAGDAGIDERSARDRQPPKLDISVQPDVLSNPNGRFRTVRISGEVRDEDEIDDVFLADVESSDPGDARDIAGARIGSFDDDVFLRAERSANGGVRRYRITFVAVDVDGNRATATATVIVPAD